MQAQIGTLSPHLSECTFYGFVPTPVLLVLSSRGRFIFPVPGILSILPGTRPETPPYSPASRPCPLPPPCCLSAGPFPDCSGSAPTTWSLCTIPGTRHGPSAPSPPQSYTSLGFRRAAAPGSGSVSLDTGLAAEPPPMHLTARCHLPGTPTPGQAS